MTDTSTDWANMFPGGVPAGEYFRILVDDLIEVVLENDEAERRNKVAPLALIGLIAYFEAFCKDLFASLINIAPDYIAALKDKGQDVNIDASAVLKHGIDPKHQLGFLLSEKYDFGTAKAINSLYGALLGITPFSKDESARFSALLHDRNLLVHHGGTYTARYLESKTPPDVPERFRVFMDSLVISSKRVSEDARFLKDLARKMIRASIDVLQRGLKEKGLLDKNTEHSLFMLRWWDDKGA